MVYFDSHRRTFSLKSPITRKVEYKCNYLEMKYCDLKVSQAGRLRVIKENKKNVHAYIIGDVVDFSTMTMSSPMKIKEFPISFGYSPWGMNCFVGYTPKSGYFDILQLEKVLMWVDENGKPNCRGFDAMCGIST